MGGGTRTEMLSLAVLVLILLPFVELGRERPRSSEDFDDCDADGGLWCQYTLNSVFDGIRSSDPVIDVEGVIDGLGCEWVT